MRTFRRGAYQPYAYPQNRIGNDLRTEGSGEGLVKETVIAGLSDKNAQRIRRVVISKRNKPAVERRVGRELLREHDLLKKAVVNKVEQPCSLNMMLPAENVSIYALWVCGWW